MNSRPASPNLATLLERLAKMTAIRDTYLLEQFLLRTLTPLIGASETRLYALGNNQSILRVLHYARTIVSDDGGVERVSELIEEVHNDRDIPDTVRHLLESVRLLDRPRQISQHGQVLKAFPVASEQSLLGYLVVQRERDTSPLEDSTISGVLGVFANYYALLDTSQRDRLTGLHNRYSLEINLDRLWAALSARLIEVNPAQDRRDHDVHHYWLGVLDIDHFKKINDTFGHIIGDEVLLIVARLFEQSLRRSDLVYRYGGEEFVAIVTAKDSEGAAHVFERVRSTIEAYNFPQVGRVTISGGFAGADPNFAPQIVINRADRSLYQAKADGRNRIYHYADLIAQGTLQELSDGSIDLF